MKRFKIFVEGDADVKFLKDYYLHLFGSKAPENSIVGTKGKDKLKTMASHMREITNNEGINLVIFDADKDVEGRRSELLEVKKEMDVDFNLFLLPNDSDAGALEDLLERIINPENQPIMDCWQTYEVELRKLEIPAKKPLTIPAKKTKIYAYLETLLDNTKQAKELVKDANREYNNDKHWNLKAEYLRPLREFLTTHLSNSES